MDFFSSVILGIVQGITEFLPVSSSGHLILLPKLADWRDQGLTFDVLLHGATLLALLIVFRNDLLKIIRGFFSKNKKERIFGWLLIIGTIPAVCAGFFGADFFESIRGVRVVAFSLIFWGVIMWIVDYWRSKRGILIKKSEKMRWYHALGIGVAQAIALIPGTSRSGITLTAGMAVGMNRKEAVRFSFLLGIPVFFGATLLKVIEVTQGGFEEVSFIFLIIGFVVAFLSGILAIKFLLKFVASHNLTVFVIYRIVLGVLILFLL